MSVCWKDSKGIKFTFVQWNVIVIYLHPKSNYICHSDSECINSYYHFVMLIYNFTIPIVSLKQFSKNSLHSNLELLKTLKEGTANKTNWKSLKIKHTKYTHSLKYGMQLQRALGVARNYN